MFPGGSDGYRLGDMFRGQLLWASNGRQYHLSHFPHSIASEYLRASQGVSNDYGTLTRIVADLGVSGYETPSLDAVVIHLRCGDVLEQDTAHVGFNGDVNSVLQNGLQNNDAFYVKPWSYFESYLRQLPETITHVSLVAGSQYDNNHNDWPYSTAYINGIRDMCVAMGFSVELVIGREADSDVVYMAHASYFISSGGGFSHLIGELVTRLGGYSMGTARRLTVLQGIIS